MSCEFPILAESLPKPRRAVGLVQRHPKPPDGAVALHSLGFSLPPFGAEQRGEGVAGLGARDAAAPREDELEMLGDGHGQVVRDDARGAGQAQDQTFRHRCVAYVGADVRERLAGELELSLIHI